MTSTTRVTSLQQPAGKYSWPAMLFLATVLFACGTEQPPNDDNRNEIDERLRAIDGVLAVEEVTGTGSEYRAFVLTFEQPVDHSDPTGPSFGQRVSLLHRATDAPTVLVSTGYHDYLGHLSTEPTWLMAANQLVVEHRYFAESRPVPTDWQYLTIEQAAADHHRIISALRQLYPDAWISTGASKGGMTSIYHRRFYPDDVDATIAYVAPISFAAPDPRYLPFFDTVGDATGDGECRQRVQDMQRDALLRRAELLPLAEDYASLYGYTYARIGGLDIGLEIAIAEFQWSFWQYLGVGACPEVPVVGASADEILAFMSRIDALGASADQFIGAFEPYYLQAATELGYPESNVEHLSDLLTAEVDIGALLPAGTVPDHAPAAMLDIADFATTTLDRTVFIYGAYDPWTAGSFDIGGNDNAHSFMVDAGTHGAQIGDLGWSDINQVADLIESWTGAPMMPVTARIGSQPARTPVIPLLSPRLAKRLSRVLLAARRHDHPPDSSPISRR